MRELLGLRLTLTREQPAFPTFYARGWLDEELTATLIPLLEAWCGKGAAFQPLLPSSDYFDERKIFRKLTGDSIALEIPELLQFMAYAFFIRRYEQSLDADAFQSWMRIVQNLVMNSNIDRADRLPGGMRAIRALLFLVILRRYPLAPNRAVRSTLRRAANP